MSIDKTVTIDSIVKQVESKLAEVVKVYQNELRPRLAQSIFRGEPALYRTALLPTLFRLGDQSKQFSEIYLYEEFQRMYPGYFDVCQHELDWLSVMQHYGAPTRLLDWTSSLSVALYFATQEVGLSEDAINNDGVLYYRLVTPERTLNSPLSDLLKELVQIRYEDDLKKWAAKWPANYNRIITDSFLYRPKQLHDRLKFQHGLFTINIGKSVEDMSNHALNNKKLISPSLTSLENEELIKKFIEKCDFYWVTYSSEDDIDKKIAETKYDIECLSRNYKSPIYVLILIQEETKKIVLNISNIRDTKIVSEVRLNHEMNIAKKPTLGKKDIYSIDLAANVLITTLRGVNPLIASSILDTIERNVKDDLTEKLIMPPDVYKITLPAAHKRVLRKHLAAMGISHNTLYPEPSNFFQGLRERFYDLSELAKE